MCESKKEKERESRLRGWLQPRRQAHSKKQSNRFNRCRIAGEAVKLPSQTDWLRSVQTSTRPPSCLILCCPETRIKGTSSQPTKLSSPRCERCQWCGPEGQDRAGPSVEVLTAPPPHSLNSRRHCERSVWKIVELDTETMGWAHCIGMAQHTGSCTRLRGRMGSSQLPPR